MALRIAINGFGRIGRCIVRAAWGRTDLEFVHINDLTSDDMLAYLLEHDTVHGRFPHHVEAVEGGIRIGDTLITTSAEKDASKLPWADKKVDIVLECTGVMTSREKAAAHLAAGAKRVIISAPATGDDGTFVFGVNHAGFDPAKHFIISNASCTTNCLAPLAMVLDEAVGIEHGLMTTIHSYTMDQNLLDGPHRKGDFRRARAAAENMVPSTTGAAKALGLVLPKLAGKLDGMAVRVPTPNGSIVDLFFRSARDTTKDELLAALEAAAAGPLNGVLEVRHEHLVSSDIVGNPASSIVDAELIQIRDGRFVKVMSWYDNEWGFSNRMLDLATYVGSRT
jgi:glyceraldehyde 3-phosphate dehydrogenase